MAVQKGGFIINKTYDPLIFRTVIRRNWWWPLVFLGFTMLIAFFYLRYTKPIYESSLDLQLSNEDNAKEIIEIENINSKKDLYFSDLELLKSQLLFEQAISTLNLNVSLYSKGEVLTEEKYLASTFNVQPYALNDSSLVGVPIFVTYTNSKITLNYQKAGKTISATGAVGEHISTKDFDVVVKIPVLKNFQDEIAVNELYFSFNSLEYLSNKFIGGLEVVPIDPAAQTIRIAYRGHNPTICRDISLAVAATFLDYSEKMKKKGSENILKFIDVQLDSLSRELKRSKDSLMYFQRNENLPDPEGVGTTMQENVDKLREDLFAMEDEIGTLNSIQTRLYENPNRLDVYRILPELLGKSYESAISGHIQALHELLESKEDMLFRLTEESAEVKRINRKVTEKLSQIQRSIAAIDGRLNAKAKNLRQKLGQLDSEFSSLPEKRMEFNRLKNIQDLNEKYYQLLKDKELQYAISDAGFISNNRILRKPIVNFEPVAPVSSLIYAVFFFLGLVIGVGVLLYKYATYNEINLLEDLESVLPEKASILGGIPLFKYNLEFSQIIVSEMPKSLIAEAMRKIRVNLSYIHPNYKTIAISSSISGEGKTFVAMNLAAIIAMSGKRTILLDLDMRKPKVHLGFGATNSNGMSGLIIGQHSLDECIHTNVGENLDVITAGPVPPNPSELLLSQRFKEILDELKQRYDVVVIDNPPIGLVSDGVKLLTEADIPIYVFKSQYSKRNFAYRIKELFEMQNLKSLNVILNGVVNNKNSVYGYGYGYGTTSYIDGYADQDSQGSIKTQNRFMAWVRKIFRRNGGN